MIDISNKISTYHESDAQSIFIESSDDSAIVKIVLNDPKLSMTVKANDLLAAIKNATNNNRWE
jgi:hypothetical protein